MWTSTGGTLSTASSQTGSAGGATMKLTSDVAGTFTASAPETLPIRQRYRLWHPPSQSLLQPGLRWALSRV
ncbi:Ig-like domain-containing protein [Enterobacter hormaechei]|uniref:Ig-like domain-containing protein n=1 Tax=Enterobacter cloacae complex TaxID=354276 RepID=UPI0012FECB76|nr:Ig-like domain-containing protein [Enterobacter hormaechei]